MAAPIVVIPQADPEPEPEPQPVIPQVEFQPVPMPGTSPAEVAAIARETVATEVERIEETANLSEAVQEGNAMLRDLLQLFRENAEVLAAAGVALSLIVKYMEDQQLERTAMIARLEEEGRSHQENVLQRFL